MKKLLLTSIAIMLLLLLPTFQLYGKRLNLQGTYYEWSGELSIMTPRGFKKIWTSYHYMKINSFEYVGGKVSIQAKIVSEFYRPELYKDRVRNISMIVSANFSSLDAVWYLYNETWGFWMFFIVSPFMIVNVGLKDIEDKLEKLWIDGGILGLESQKHGGEFGGIMFESWNIELGAYRGIYYYELYYRSVLLNINESSKDLSNSSVLEIDVSIDKSLGIILSARMFWMYKDLYHQITISLTDTNAFTKYTFYVYVFLFVIIIIVVVATYKIYKRRKRKRLIQV